VLAEVNFIKIDTGKMPKQMTSNGRVPTLKLVDMETSIKRGTEDVNTCPKDD
jgi:hypothetical protein